MPRTQIRDRHEAGSRLAGRLAPWTQPDTVVLAIGRDAVPTAFQAARLIGAPLDVLVVVNVPAPGRSDVIVGAVTENRIRVSDPYQVAHFAAERGSELDSQFRTAFARLRDSVALLRGDRTPIGVKGRTLILVSDGFRARGADIDAAIAWAQMHQAARIAVAVPFVPREAAARLRKKVDLVTLGEPEDVESPRHGYEEFHPVDAHEAAALLETARHPIWATEPFDMSPDPAT